MMYETEEEYVCTVCEYRCPKKQRMVYHIEAKHASTPGYQCSLCKKECSTKNAFMIHKSRFHRR